VLTSIEITVPNGATHMKRPRTLLSTAGLGLCLAVGIAAALVGLRAAPAHGSPTATKTVITVTMSEYKFKLSKTKNIPVGTVTFKLVNKGKIPHNFKINGKTSKMINPGKTGTLTVTFKKKGSFAYLCTVTGHAKLGMKGTLGIAVAPPTTTTPTTTTPAATCASPVATTVTVSEFEYGFTLSQTTVPCGTVTFQMTNAGSIVHDFIVYGAVPATSGIGATLNPGATATMQTVLTHAGQFQYICDVPHHAELGMNGMLTVTG
jgi:uncharacterized cupredoxin-like copper-binding protein